MVCICLTPGSSAISRCGLWRLRLKTTMWNNSLFWSCIQEEFSDSFSAYDFAQWQVWIVFCRTSLRFIWRIELTRVTLCVRVKIPPQLRTKQCLKQTDSHMFFWNICLQSSDWGVRLGRHVGLETKPKVGIFFYQNIAFVWIFNLKKSSFGYRLWQNS